MNQHLSLTANLLGDPGRAAIVLSLMDGLALPAGELASIANVAPQTASGHLARLSGRRWFQSLGIEIPEDTRALSKLARRCLDWTERRHHLAGPLGCSMYKRLVELRWVVPIRGTRAVRVTLEGKSRLWELLRLPIG